MFCQKKHKQDENSQLRVVASNFKVIKRRISSGTLADAEWPRCALLAGRLARPVRVRCSTRFTTGRRDNQDQSGGAGAKNGAATTLRHFWRPDLHITKVMFPHKKNLEDFCHVLLSYVPSQEESGRLVVPDTLKLARTVVPVRENIS